MAEIERGVVIGVFEDRRAVIRTIDILLKAGFHEDQLGFAARGQEEHIQQVHKQAQTPNSVLRGVVGGILGVADMLLVPITGPSDAAGILASVLPVTEEAIDHLPYPGSQKDEEMPVRPDAAMTMLEQTAQETSATATTAPHTPDSAAPGDTEATERAAEAPARTGIITGGVIGGVLGAAAALLLPGIGPVVAGGVLAAIFGGGAIGGVAGGFLGAFTGMGVPEEQARYYEREIKAGRTILTVHTTVRQQEVADILRQNGAHDVQAHG